MAEKKSTAVSGNVGIIRMNWSPEMETNDRFVIVGLHGSEAVSVADRLLRTILHDKTSDDAAEPSIQTVTGGIASIGEALASHDQTRLIVVLDDPASLALAWESLGVAAMPNGLRQAASDTAALCDVVVQSKSPVMLLSAYRSGMFPHQSLEALSVFCGVSPTAASRSAALAIVDSHDEEPVISVPDQPVIQGALDRNQRPGTIRGWAKQPLSTERIHVQAWCDGAVVGDAVAERMRDDLVAHRVGDGRHGFQINVSDALSDETKEFEIRSSRSGAVVGGVLMSRDRAALREENA